MNTLLAYYEQFLRFLDRGGPVVLAILLASTLMWTLIIERYYFMHRIYPARLQAAVKAWRARADHRSWHAHCIREQMLSELTVLLRRHLILIRSLTTVLPLLGLLGTVTGMVTSFEVLRVFGTGNARGLTAGISQALFATLAGLLTALSGLYFSLHLQRRARAAIHQAEQSLSTV